MGLFCPEPARSGRNAAADAVVQYSDELGIVFDGESSDASEPKMTDFDSFRQMGLSAWLKSQVEHESDEITEPPATLREVPHRSRDFHREARFGARKARPGLGQTDRR